MPQYRGYTGESIPQRHLGDMELTRFYGHGFIGSGHHE
jgi:hypothetical protein